MKNGLFSRKYVTPWKIYFCVGNMLEYITPWKIGFCLGNMLRHGNRLFRWEIGYAMEICTRHAFCCVLWWFGHWGNFMTASMPLMQPYHIEAERAAIFQTTFLNTFSWIKMYKFRLRYPNGPINYIPALFQIMAWRRPGDKPLSEPMVVCLLTHICVTRPQWVDKHW